MTRSSAIVDLKNALGENDWPRVIPALRQDPLVWLALQSADFRLAAINKLGPTPEVWSPANLALIALGSDLRTQHLRAAKNIHPELIAQVYLASQPATKNITTLTLAQAGLLALEIINQPRRWGELTHTALHHCVLACLFAILPNPATLFNAISVEQAIHAVLANPFTAETQLEQIEKRLLAAPADERLAALNTLREQRPEIAAKLAQHSPKRTTPAPNLRTHNPRAKGVTASLHMPLTDLQSMLHQADEQQIAGDAQDARATLISAQKAASQIQISIALELAKSAIQEGNPEEALTLWKQAGGQALSDQTANLVMALIDHGYLAAAQSLAEPLNNIESENSPLVLITKARITMFSGDLAAARELAQQAIELVNTDNTYTWDASALANLLLELGMHTQAIEVGENYIQQNPNSAATAKLLAKAYRGTGEAEPMLHWSHLAVALEPKNTTLQRDLAEGLELLDEWQQAYDIRKKLLHATETPSPDDQFALAKTALRAGHPQRAAEAAQGLILSDPHDGAATALMGQALVELGQRNEARQLFEKAIQISPLISDPWLALADFYQQEHEWQQAFHTLQTASRSVPEAPDVHLALGKIYQQQGDATQALAAFRKASELADTATQPSAGNLTIEIQLALGNTLLALGHAEEARQQLESAYRQAPHTNTLVHSYARSLIATEQPQKAAELLEPLLETPGNTPIELDYARSLMAMRERDTDAQAILKGILERDAKNPTATALMAEVLERSGDAKAALTAYRTALSINLEQNPLQAKSLALNLGRLALAEEQHEIALGVLEHFGQQYPDDPQIARLLTQAYRVNGISEKALETAQVVLRVEPATPERVLWFVDQALDLKAPEQALAALNQSIEKNVSQSSLHLKRAQVLLQVNEHSSARRAFEQVSIMENVTPAELGTTAEGLLATDSPQQAILSFERAIRMAQQDSEQDHTQMQLGLLKKLAATQKELKDHPSALKALDEALVIAPADSSLVIEKAELLLEMEQLEQAGEWVESQLAENPTDPHLNLQAALILRLLGDLPKAAVRAQSALHGFQENGSENEGTLAATIGGQIAIAMLRDEDAAAILATTAGMHPQQHANDSAVAYYCLLGELALQNNEEVAAADVLTRALQIDPQHPRALALHTRLRIRQGGGAAADELFDEAMKQFGENQRAQRSAPEDYYALAEAAIECHAWDPAAYLLKKVAKLTPREPRAQLQLARILALRAEFQRFYQDVHLSKHALGESALGEHNYQQFEIAILNASQLVEIIQAAGLDTRTRRAKIAYWMARGQAAFQPSDSHTQALLELPSTVDNLTATLAALRHSAQGPGAAQKAQQLLKPESGRAPEAPILLCQIALALLDENPVLANQAAEKALNKAIRENIVTTPLYHAVRATVAGKLDDPEVELQAIQALLALCDNEAYWYERAADIIAAQHNAAEPLQLAPAIEYLEKALLTEPHSLPLYHKLGHAQVAIGDLPAAIHTYRQATALAPEDHRLWLYLARGYHTQGSIREARASAQKVLNLQPDHETAHLILAELDLGAGRVENAQRHTAKALRVNPRNPRALLMHAETLTAQGQVAQALAALETAAARMIPTVELLLKIVDLKRQVYGEKVALESLLQLSEAYPQDDQILIALAHCLAKNGEKQRAIQTAQKALQHAENAGNEGEHARLLHLLGQLLREGGQLDQAIQHLILAIDQRPDWVPPYLELGRAYHERRQYNLALQTYHQAIAIAPEDASAYHLAGQALKDAKDYANAESMLRKAARLNPENISIQRQLAAMIAMNLVHNPRKTFATVDEKTA